MGIKSILCIFGGSESELSAVNTALLLARAHNAHVRFLHITADPKTWAAVYGYDNYFASATFLESCEKDNRERLKKAQEYAASLSAKHGIPLDAESARHPSAQFIRFTGRPDMLMAREGQLTDLIVMGRTRQADPLYDLTITAAIFNTGRPIMLLPPEESEAPGQYRTIAVAWKGTVEAGRAIYNAMPLLETAEKVLVLTAKGPGEAYDRDAEIALMGYLRAHGIQAQGIVVAAGARPAGEALLIRARELKADLMVMGAYGHSRFREMMLGGVTHDLIGHADMPLLLSH